MQLSLLFPILVVLALLFIVLASRRFTSSTPLARDAGVLDPAIAQIWSAMLLESLKKALVFGQPTVVNRDYEGDIADQGDTVRINSISRPTIASYVKGSTSISPEQLTAAQRLLVVDQAKYFAFEVDDIDARQMVGGALEAGLVEAAYSMAEVADEYIAGLYTGIQSANAIGTVSVTSADLAFQQIVQLRRKLNEANVPMAGRWVVIPPWYEALLLQDNRIVTQYASGSTAALRNGVVGQLMGFDVLVSNNAPFVTGDDYAVIAGYPGAISYAEQINKVEAYRPQSAFADALKGLHLYGAKLVRPDGLAWVQASIT